MLQLAKSLGNSKPAILVEVERLLWKSLLEIATGKETTYKAMNIFFSKIPWDKIAMVSDADQAHFADSKFSKLKSVEQL